MAPDKIVITVLDESSDNKTKSTPRAGQESAKDVIQTPRQPVTRAVSTLTTKPPGACYNSFVTLEVGHERKLFAMHRGLLTFYSDFFRGAFNGPFKEATEGRITLSTERIHIVNSFNEFLYTGCLFDGDIETVSWADLVAVWLFGDKYLVPALQNTAMDMLRKKVRFLKEVPVCAIPAIWENTLPSSPIREWMLELIVYKTEVNTALEHANIWTEEPLKDLVRAMCKREIFKGKHKLPKHEKCYYHIHGEGEKCG